MTKPTLKDIASAARVSEATASRALALNPAIASDTRERIWLIAQQLGYSKHLTRDLKKTASTDRENRRVIAIVTSALHNSFYPFLVDKIHSELDALGYEMTLVIDEMSNNADSRKMRSLLDTPLAGIIFTTARIGSPTVNLFVAKGIPTVLAVRSNKQDNTTVIESDNFMAGYEAAQHLFSLGHKRYGALLGPRDTSTALERLEGYEAFLKAKNIIINPDHMLWGRYTHEAGYAGMLQLSRTPHMPTAIFCANDVIAIGAMDAAKKIGLRIPDDVSVIGVDDIPMASWSIIDLTTIRQPLNDIAITAVRRLVDQIETQTKPTITNEKLPTSLVRRNTTAPASNDPIK